MSLANHTLTGPLVQIQGRSAATTIAPTGETDLHLFETELGRHVLLVNGSRVFTISQEIAAVLEGDPEQSESLLEEWDWSHRKNITDEPLAEAPVRSLSLAIAQKCNLGCTYCYAEEGGFGAKEKDMTPDAARAAVDLLFSETGVGDRVNLSFLGGEPLTNRKTATRVRRASDHSGTNERRARRIFNHYERYARYARRRRVFRATRLRCNHQSRRNRRGSRPSAIVQEWTG